MSATTTKYPEIEVQLSGEDGNALAILGRVTSALKRGGVPREEREEFMNEATRGTYDELLQTCDRWVTVT